MARPVSDDRKKQFMKLSKEALVRFLLDEIKKNENLKEENKTLKDKIEFLTKCLDDRDKSIALMQKQEYPFGPVKTISEPTNGR